MTRITCALFCLAVVAVGERGPRASAATGFEEIRSAAAKSSNGRAFEGLFVRGVFKSMREGEGARLRAKLASELAQATTLKVTERDDSAVVRFRSATDKQNEVRELLLEHDGTKWFIASATGFPVSGKALEERRGNKKAKVRLKERTQNATYGASAYSFTHVTGDANQCKNRMDVWFCHNGDFHATRGTITDLGKTSWNKIKGIPVRSDFGTEAHAAKGHSYVLRCGPNAHRDFFVLFKVKKLKKGIVELEWTILADGLNAPSNIHKLFPCMSSDGADGCAGLCGKNG